MRLQPRSGILPPESLNLRGERPSLGERGARPADGGNGLTPTVDSWLVQEKEELAQLGIRAALTGRCPWSVLMDYGWDSGAELANVL